MDEQAKPKKAAFGGYTVCFANCHETAEHIFGKEPLPPSQMTKKLWAYVKAKGLSKK